MSNYRKLVLLAAIVIMTVTAHAKPNIIGKVVDDKGQPLPLANVVLLSLPDSAFVQGDVTDEHGQFNITTQLTGGLLKVSVIGYETVYAPAATGLTITMAEEAMMLAEVVVKGTLPKTRVVGDAMRTTVAGTILEKAGSVTDMLSKIPSLEAEEDKNVQVLGRGDAEVYINGRKVQDMQELARITADQIEHVDVVQNPGARYAATTRAVVRLTLKKAQGDGFSFREQARAIYRYGYAVTNNLDLNYRTSGLDITASLWAGRYGHNKSLEEQHLIYYVGPDLYEGKMNQDAKNTWTGWSPQLQINYMVNQDNSLGAFYKFDRNPDNDFSGMFNADTYINGNFAERSESAISQNESFSKHIFNAYYNGKVNKLAIDLNIDGLFDKTKEATNTDEHTTDTDKTGTARNLMSNTAKSNNFVATKLILSYPVWQGNLSVGGEYSYNHRTDAYAFTASEAVPVKATDIKINEHMAAAFVEYGRRFGRLFVQAGLRYEHLNNDYYNFGMRQDEVCRNYGDWFPTAMLAMPVGQVQLSLAYRQDIERPHYSSLTSSTVYINHYTYQSGNPLLRPTYTHSLVLNVGYKWSNLTVDYARTRDNVTQAMEPYPGIDDPLINLFRPINGSDGFDRVMIIAAAQPKFNFTIAAQPCAWHPRWTVVTGVQNYKTPCAAGSIITLNRPVLQLTWDNDIELPKGWRINLQAWFSSKGDFGNFRVERCPFRSQVGLQRDINLKRWGSLTIDARCSDLFNTDKMMITVYGMRDLTNYTPPRRTFNLRVTWKFNEAGSKYRGSGAGDKQKARM